MDIEYSANLNGFYGIFDYNVVMGKVYDWTNTSLEAITEEQQPLYTNYITNMGVNDLLTNIGKSLDTTKYNVITREFSMD